MAKARNFKPGNFVCYILLPFSIKASQTTRVGLHEQAGEQFTDVRPDFLGIEQSSSFSVLSC